MAAIPASASEVTFNAGRVTIRCNNENLGQVFDQIKAAMGLELFLESSVRSTRLTAEIVNEPTNRALERLLEGSGLNYVMMMDRVDWQRVAKMYIGSDGGSGGRSQAPAASARREPIREVEEPEPFEEPAPAEDFSNENVTEEPEPADPSLQQAPPPVAPGPSYLPPPQVYPRSSFTPGMETSPFAQPNTGGAYGSNPYNANPFGAPQGGAAAPGQGSSGNAPPPANFPFVDAFGRPIPVPQQNPKNPK